MLVSTFVGLALAMDVRVELLSPLAPSLAVLAAVAIASNMIVSFTYVTQRLIGLHMRGRLYLGAGEHRPLRPSFEHHPRIRASRFGAAGLSLATRPCSGRGTNILVH